MATWTATLVVSDGVSRARTAGVVRIEVDGGDGTSL